MNPYRKLPGGDYKIFFRGEFCARASLNASINSMEYASPHASEQKQMATARLSE